MLDRRVTLSDVGFQVVVDQRGVRVDLSGWDRALNLRRAVVLPVASVGSARIALRGELEPEIDHRVLGWGTHLGKLGAGKRRVGTMLGRGVVGKQFWALPASGPDLEVLVVDLTNGDFVRVVLAVGQPEAAAEQLNRAGPGS